MKTIKYEEVRKNKKLTAFGFEEDTELIENREKVE